MNTSMENIFYFLLCDYWTIIYLIKLWREKIQIKSDTSGVVFPMHDLMTS